MSGTVVVGRARQPPLDTGSDGGRFVRPAGGGSDAASHERPQLRHPPPRSTGHGDGSRDVVLRHHRGSLMLGPFVMGGDRYVADRYIAAASEGDPSVGRAPREKWTDA